MKKLKTTLAKTQALFCELVLRENAAIEKSTVGYQMFNHEGVYCEKAMWDIRMKSYSIRKFNF